jgi:crotonobetainyl-CoA:carnitine CoA-transferase CaiB-like acyl-CoA transferase
VVDFYVDLHTAFSIVALLARVRSGGSDRQVEIPMLATTLAISPLQTSEYFGTGQNLQPLGSAHPSNAP